ncbi:MAG TPA: peptidase S41, partial [Streptomyces sp.]
MLGPGFCRRPRRHGAGAALTLVFAGVLAAAVVTDSLPREKPDEPRVLSKAARPAAATVDRQALSEAAAQAIADGKSGTQAAEEFVSRSGDRWGAVYDPREYEEFEQALDGAYTGVGLSARRTADGRVEVARVRADGPAGRAGLRAGDR